MLILKVLSVFAQGLNYETEYDEDYFQTAAAVLVLDNYTYYAVNRHYSGSYYTIPHTLKYDTSGQKLWDVQIMPLGAEITYIHNIFPDSDSGVYVCGGGDLGCDFVLAYYSFVCHLDAGGNVLWSVVITNGPPYVVIHTTSSGMLTSGEILLCKSYGPDSKLYIVNAAGTITDSLLVPRFGLNNFTGSLNTGLIASIDDSLFFIDPSGSITIAKGLGSDVESICQSQDTLFVLTADSLYIFADSLEEISSFALQAYGNYSTLSDYDGNLHWISRGVTCTKLLSFDKQLQLLKADSIPFILQSNQKVSYNSEHISLLKNYHLTDYFSVQMFDYSLKSAQNTIPERCDIKVSAMQIDSINVIQPYVIHPNVYRGNIKARILIENEGPSMLHSCHIKCFLDWGICNDYYHIFDLNNLAIPPGSSQWAELGWVGQITNQYSDSIIIHYCFFSSHPNGLSDNNISNDKYCENVLFGYVGLDEDIQPGLRIFPNPTSGIIHFENINDTTLQYFIYDLPGQEYLHGYIQNKPVDLSALPAGMYIIRISEDDGSTFFSQKIIKQ